RIFKRKLTNQHIFDLLTVSEKRNCLLVIGRKRSVATGNLQLRPNETVHIDSWQSTVHGDDRDDPRRHNMSNHTRQPCFCTRSLDPVLGRWNLPVAGHESIEPQLPSSAESQLSVALGADNEGVDPALRECPCGEQPDWTGSAHPYSVARAQLR